MDMSGSGNVQSNGYAIYNYTEDRFSYFLRTMEDCKDDKTIFELYDEWESQHHKLPADRGGIS